MNTLVRIGLCMAIAMCCVMAQESPGEATRAFFGEKSSWKGLSIMVQQISPLYGGRKYFISGSGPITIVDMKRDAEGQIVERRFVTRQAARESTALLEKVFAANLLDANLERGGVPPPSDSGAPLFVLRNAEGEVRSLPGITGAPTPAYEEVLVEIAALMSLTRGSAPVYEGPYDAGYLPEDFSWAAAAPSRNDEIGWAPAASRGENARAEAEYQKKVDLQLQQIERAKAEEEQANNQQ